jgi:glutamine amidotransferase
MSQAERTIVKSPIKIAIIRYNAGNTFSVQVALERIGVGCLVTDDPAEIRAASHVIFPGVGEARSAMTYLRERRLDCVIRELRQPVLGICLGLQLMCDFSSEGATECLGIFKTQADHFNSALKTHLKVPHIGWNAICLTNNSHTPHPILVGLGTNPYLYFVHSYQVALSNETIATCDYGITFTAMAAKDNFVGVQFHPEKSGQVGERILRNFVEWCV